MGGPVRVREDGSGTRKGGGYGTLTFRRQFAMVVVVPLGGERPCTSAGLRQPAQRNRTGRDKKSQIKNPNVWDTAIQVQPSLTTLPQLLAKI